MQLASQHREMIVVLGVQQPHSVLGEPHDDGITFDQRKIRLAVATQARVLAAQQLDLDHNRIAHGNGAVSQRVRRDWHQQDGRYAGFHDRALGRQRVGSRTGRRGDDQAVGAHGVDEAAVYRHRAIDHTALRAAIDDDIVERQRALLVARGGLAHDVCAQQGTRFLDVRAGQHRGEGAFHVGEGDVGQEAEASLIDTDQRHIEPGESPRDRQHRAVTADNDRELGFTPELRQRRCRITWKRRELRGFRIEQYAMSATGEKRREPLQRLGNASACIAPHQRDGRKGLGEGGHGRD